MSKKRILLVDDDRDLVESVRMHLEMENYECMVAHDGYNGLDLARNDNPDLIILDVMLPGMNGFKICRLIKFDEPYKAVPIIMLTSEAQKQDRLIGEYTGADFYMTKPFSADKLLEKIKEYLGE